MNIRPETAPRGQGQFVTDDELRAAGISELDIDALDRNLPTQKNYSGNRDRMAVEAVLRTRRSGK